MREKTSDGRTGGEDRAGFKRSFGGPWALSRENSLWARGMNLTRAPLKSPLKDLNLIAILCCMDLSISK